MYSTLEDIKKLLPEATLRQLTDDEKTSSVNEQRVSEAISQADAEIDSYCSQVYQTPFTTVPPVIKKCSVDMAIYHLYSRRVEAIPETRATRYKDAIRLLRGVVDGDVSLNIPTDDSSATFASGVLITSHFDNNLL